MSQTQNWYILRISDQKLKQTYFYLMTTFYNFTLKIETSWEEEEEEETHFGNLEYQ